LLQSVAVGADEFGGAAELAAFALGGAGVLQHAGRVRGAVAEFVGGLAVEGGGGFQEGGGGAAGGFGFVGTGHGWVRFLFEWE